MTTADQVIPRRWPSTVPISPPEGPKAQQADQGTPMAAKGANPIAESGRAAQQLRSNVGQLGALAIELRHIIESLDQVVSSLDAATCLPQRPHVASQPPSQTPEHVLLRRFLSEEVRISGSKNADLSTGELIEVLIEYCRMFELPTPPLTKIKRALPAVMSDMFGAVRTHSLTRDGKACRDFRGVEFKPCNE